MKSYAYSGPRTSFRFNGKDYVLTPNTEPELPADAPSVVALLEAKHLQLLPEKAKKLPKPTPEPEA